MKLQGQPMQQQNPPGTEEKMVPKPESENPKYRPSDKLKGKVALITGGDSGIGKATALSFAKEGADIAIIYLSSDNDAHETKQRIEEIGRNCLLIKGDVGDRTFCSDAVERVVKTFE